MGRVTERPPDWQARFDAVLKIARERNFDSREWNCARFAHTCAQAVSGRHIPFCWRGSLEDSANAVLERLPDPRQARVGDIVLASVPEPSLGVCVGAKAVFVTAQGLLRYPMMLVSVAWSV